MRSHAGGLTEGAERTEFTNGATEKTETKRRGPDDLQPRKGAWRGWRASAAVGTSSLPSHLFVPAAALAHHAALRAVAPWC